ncbi:putative neutral zinc metallopeptidase [Methylibium sp. T29]|nr:putative neutral zinc metallopeptidase [Methylibium sp. T29]
MKWEGQEQSDNVEDRRGMGGGGRGGLPIGGRGIGVGTIVIVLVAGWIFGINRSPCSAS